MGSAGKTSAHRLIYKLLGQNVSIRKSKKANSALGVPLDILGIHFTNYSKREWLLNIIKIPFYSVYRYLFPYNEKYYLIELDVDRPGEMKFAAGYIKPEIIFWTSSFATHTANFSALVTKNKKLSEEQAVANEFARLVYKLNKNGLLIYNGDSKYIKKAISKINKKKLAIKEDNGKYSFSAWSVYRKRTEFEILLNKNKKNEGQVFQVVVPYIVPKNFGYTLVALYVLADIFKIDRKTVDTVLENSSFPPGRLTVFECINDTKIIDSSYNSSFESAYGLLEVLAEYSGKRKIAVIGDMRELGKQSEAEHLKLAKAIVQFGIDQVILVGTETAEYIFPVLLKAGYTDTNLHHFYNTYQAGLFLKETILKKGDTVLIKASQNTLFFEIITEMLLANKADEDKLCRREPIWQVKRQRITDEFYKSIE
jgi:UDP-N-acetylmuramoyl-tripeptide--D-alanyl-D-alanine ligase